MEAILSILCIIATALLWASIIYSIMRSSRSLAKEQLEDREKIGRLKQLKDLLDFIPAYLETADVHGDELTSKEWRVIGCFAKVLVAEMGRFLNESPMDQMFGVSLETLEKELMNAIKQRSDEALKKEEEPKKTVKRKKSAKKKTKTKK